MTLPFRNQKDFLSFWPFFDIIIRRKLNNGYLKEAVGLARREFSMRALGTRLSFGLTLLFFARQREGGPGEVSGVLS